MRAVILLLVFAAACGHEEPFRPETYTPEPPPFSGSARLTFNTGADRTPSWLPDGSGILYSLERLDRADQDRCLGRLPPEGGTLMRISCHRTPAADDSTDVFESAAAHGDGRLAYVRASSPVRPRPLAPRVHGLALATVADPDEFVVLRILPYPVPGGTHENLSQLQWLNDSQLVYLGERVAYAGPCGGCPPDTLRSGIGVAILSARPGASVTVIPGTDGASGVSVRSPDTIYYTINGDSRVFRRALSSGVIDVLFDFGPGRVARDVGVIDAERILAVVDGRVGTRDISGIGPMQVDSGGTLRIANLTTSSASLLTPGNLWFRRPRVRPGGDRFTVEAYPYQVVGADTLVSTIADVWLLAVP